MAQAETVGQACCGGAGTRAKATREQVAAIPTPDLVARYRVGVENFDPRIFSLSDERLDMAFLADANVGRWPVRVLLGHLADAELVFTHRMRRTVGEDNPVFALWDENAFIDAGLYGGAGAASGSRYPIGGFAATVHTLRRWTSEWLATLDDARFARKAMHPTLGPLSVRDILVYATWHLEHHSWYLNAKVERMVGPIGAGEAASSSGGGCGSGCGCRGK